MRSRTQRHSPPGFTLIEALIALVILVFSLIGITNLFLIAAGSTTAANESSAATTAATETLECLKGLRFDELTPGGGVGLQASLPGNLSCSNPNPPDTPGLAGVATSTCAKGGYSRCDDVAGVGRIRTEWEILQAANDPALLFIRVRSEGIGPFGGARSRAEFTTFRTCTARTKTSGGRCPDSTYANP